MHRKQPTSGLACRKCPAHGHCLCPSHLFLSGWLVLMARLGMRKRKSHLATSTIMTSRERNPLLGEWWT